MLEGKKISELDQIDTLSLGSSFPVLDKGATKRIAFSALLNKIENELPESDIDKVKDDVEKLKVKTESINTLTTEMEAVKDQVSGVDEMVQGQNATIRNCVSAVEGLEQTIEQTHFDDVLALEEQVRSNTTNVEKKLNKTTDSANAGKAVVVDENGNLVFGAAGVQVSEAEGNAIEEKEDGIYVAGGTLYADTPVGTIIPFGGSVIPRGYLFCNGQAVSRVDYAELFAIIGTAFGAGDGSSTFNVPDLRETLPVGVGENTNLTIAAHDVYALGQFKDDQLQGHSHDLEWSDGLPNYSEGGLYSGGGSYNSNIKKETKLTIKGVATDGENGTPRVGTTTHGKQLGVNYVIKAKHVAMPADFVDAVSKVNSYSTEETVIGKWIDGKPIYRKVLDVRTNGLGVTGFSINISDLNIDYLVNSNVLGSGNNNYSGNKWVLSCVTSSGTRELYLEGATQNLRGKSNEYMQFAILEYTKTTD